MSGIGLIPAQQTMSNVKTNRFLEVGEPIVAPDLISPIAMSSQATTAYINIQGDEGDAYNGGISFTTGANVNLDAPARDAMTLYSGIDGTQAYIGSNVPAGVENILSINGEDGLGRVYDEIYNQPTTLETITILASNPNLTPTGGAEILRATQTAVAVSSTVSQFNRFQVPKTGAYMFQTEIRMGNTGATNSVVLPSTLLSGVPIWNGIALQLQEFGTVNPTPYGSVEIIGGDYQAIDTFASTSITSKVFGSVVFLDSTKVYAIVLSSNSALWNIGTAGQIKSELIAMC